MLRRVVVGSGGGEWGSQLSKWGWMEEDILDWVGLLLGWIAGCGVVPLRGKQEGRGGTMHVCCVGLMRILPAAADVSQADNGHAMEAGMAGQGKSRGQHPHSRGNHSSASVKKAHHHSLLPCRCAVHDQAIREGGSSLLLIGTTAHAPPLPLAANLPVSRIRRLSCSPSLLPPILPFSSSPSITPCTAF